MVRVAVDPEHWAQGRNTKNQTGDPEAVRSSATHCATVPALKHLYEVNLFMNYKTCALCG